MDDFHTGPDESVEFQSVNPIIELLGMVRDVHRNVASLLKTSDALLAKHRWNPLYNVAVTHTRAVYSPADWSPTEAHRFYGKVPFQQITTFAIPLASVGNSASLQTQIIDPLLGVINRVIANR